MTQREFGGDVPQPSEVGPVDGGDLDPSAEGYTEGESGPRVEPEVECRPEPEVDLGRLAGTSVGRVALSGIVGLLVAMLVIWNLPSSEIRNELRPGIRPIMNAVALDQSWSVFAPNPTTTSIAVEADVTMADGQVVRYRFPGGDDFIGAYREYRWRKWERRVRLDEQRRMWRPAAEWVARQFDEPVANVALIREFSETPEPGSGDERVWESVQFYDLDFPDVAGAES